jgi:hypothetical protein
MFRRENTPFARNALERVDATVTEAQPGAGHQILDSARHQNLGWAGERRDTRAYVNGDSTDVVADYFALTCMEPGTDLYSERLDFLGNGTGAANAACRTVKGGQKTVARRLHLVAAKTREITPDRGMMFIEEISPALVAERRSLLGRADDVREQNGCEDAIDRYRGP